MLQPSESWHRSWEFALKLSRDMRGNPTAPYCGKFVGVAQETVVAVADSFEALSRKMDDLGIAPGDTVMIDTAFDYDKPIHLF